MASSSSRRARRKTTRKEEKRRRSSSSRRRTTEGGSRPSSSLPPPPPLLLLLLLLLLPDLRLRLLQLFLLIDTERRWPREEKLRRVPSLLLPNTEEKKPKKTQKNTFLSLPSCEAPAPRFPPGIPLHAFLVFEARYLVILRTDVIVELFSSRPPL